MVPEPFAPTSGASSLYEQDNQVERAFAAYRDLIKNAGDPELVAAEARADRLRTAKR